VPGRPRPEPPQLAPRANEAEDEVGPRRSRAHDRTARERSEKHVEAFRGGEREDAGGVLDAELLRRGRPGVRGQGRLRDDRVPRRPIPYPLEGRGDVVPARELGVRRNGSGARPSPARRRRRRSAPSCPPSSVGRRPPRPDLAPEAGKGRRRGRRAGRGSAHGARSARGRSRRPGSRGRAESPSGSRSRPRPSRRDGRAASPTREAAWNGGHARSGRYRDRGPFAPPSRQRRMHGG